jgi:phosphatidylglycerophosphatase C
VATVTVAAFDFDNTLSDRDNVLPFLLEVGGRAAVVSALSRSLPDLALRHRDAVKARLSQAVFAGRPEADVRAAATTFAADVVANHLRDDVVARAEWHGEQGHRRVIVSASFECYLTPIAAALGFDAALATGLAVDDTGRLTGALDGPNVRRAEKVRRLEEWLAEPDGTLWVYGDSAGDRELLARADHAVRVAGDPITREPQHPPDDAVAG